MNTLDINVGLGVGYERWLEAAELELYVNQAALEKTHRLGKWPRWDADLEKGLLTFSDKKRIRVCADICIAGTTGKHDWMWGWANEHLPREHTADGLLVRQFGVEQEFALLSDTNIASDDPEALGWRLAAAAAKILHSCGVYRAPTRNGAAFLLIKSLSRVEKR